MKDEFKLLNALDEFYVFCESIVHELNNEVKEAISKERLYHYTTSEGLKGILQSNKLWLTNIFNLNDPSELRHGVSIGINKLKVLIESKEQDFFVKRFNDIYEKNIERTAHYFVFSTSSNQDELGQWRAYSDDGTGYALEFDSKILECIFSEESRIGDKEILNANFDVIYNTSKIQNYYDKILSNAMTLIQLPYKLNCIDNIKYKFLTDLSVKIIQVFINVALYFKHEGYISEEEFRFVQVFDYLGSVPDVEHRYRKDELIKYREFHWKLDARSALTKIIIGPSANKTKAERYINDLLQLNNHNLVCIEHSKIPYRSYKS